MSLEAVNAGDKRRFSRYRVRIAVDCSTKEMFVSNYVTNISRGGVFVSTDHPFPLHSEVALTLALPGSSGAIDVVGRVVWTYDIRKADGRLVPGMGIRFLDLPANDRSRLEQYLGTLPCQA